MGGEENKTKVHEARLNVPTVLTDEERPEDCRKRDFLRVFRLLFCLCRDCILIPLLFCANFKSTVVRILENRMDDLEGRRSGMSIISQYDRI